ncbi:MAG TPA: YdeI/OmpD-associated family protein [Bryobacteraceae bacterium]|nr:YdeI/OmpD-associated family protein [Bryobacteraceae bacterium]
MAAKAKPKTGAKSFQATLERDNSPLKWVIARIPFDVSKVWGTRGRLRVKGDINGFAFRNSLFPNGQGGHVLLVNKKMQAGAKAAAGMTARFRLEPDLEERIFEMPAELERFLAEDRALRRWFEQLTPATRNDIARWTGDVKSAEARQRRAEQIAERMLATMEAERELPPLIRVAFARYPLALEGWKRMSTSNRRRHLFGIFHYRSPEGQARRLAKTVQEACEFAKKRMKEPGH